MTTKLFSLAGIAMLCFSCSNDEPVTAPPIATNNDAVFDYYTVESTTTAESAGASFVRFTTANLQDEKFFSETVTQTDFGVPMEAITAQHYFYESGRLVKRAYDNDVRDFFYDGEGNLVGLNWVYNNGLTLYYRFVHVSASKVFFERTDLPYNDPAAAVSNRIVVEFDDADNLIKAGRDSDLDGAANWEHNFSYDASNNLINVAEYGGNNISISYAPIKDNFAKLAINTYGKKNLLIYQAECYANLTMEDLRHSPDLRLTDTQENLIEVQAFPYYFRKTKTLTLDEGVNTMVTTFYFQ